MALVPILLIFILLYQVIEVGDSNPFVNFLRFGERSKDMDICPSESRWQARSQSLCPEDPSWYHCLPTKTGKYMSLEICIKPISVQAGTYPVILEQDRQAQLSIETCPSTHYQQISQLSSQFKRVGCDGKKSVCNAEGEETCEDGGPTRNRLCRCKYYMDYVAEIFLINNEKNKMCYDKKMGGSRCVKYPCRGKGKELNAAYKCVNVCPSGFYRPRGQLICVRNETFTRTSSTTSTTSTTTAENNGKSVDMNKNGNESSAAENEDWIGAVVVILVLLPIVIFVSITYFCGDKLFHVKLNGKELNKKVHTNETLKASLHVHCPVCIIHFSSEFSWTKRKDEIESEVSTEDDFKYQITNTQRSSSLTITNLQVEDQAEYICTATIRILKCFKAFKKRESILLLVKEDETVPKENSGKTENPLDSSPQTVNIYIANLEKAVIGDRGVISYQAFVQEKVEEQSNENDTFLQEKNDDESKKVESLSGGNDLLLPKNKKMDDNKSQDVETCPEEKNPLLTENDQDEIEETRGARSELENNMAILDRLAREAPYNLKVHDVPGDNHCLYHAFIYLYAKQHEISLNIKDLRKFLTKYFEYNPKDEDGTPFCEYLAPDSEVITVQVEDAHIEKLVDELNKGELRWQRFLEGVGGEAWGGNLELLGLSQLYNVPITVLSVGSDDQRLRKNEINHNKETLKNPVMFIGHLSVNGKGTHFVALESCC